MRGRPAVELRVPRRVQPGDRLVVEVSLEFADRTPVEHVHLDLVGEVVSVTRQDARTVVIQHARAEISGKTEFDPGTYARRAVFDLSATLPPSYRGAYVESRYRLELRVAIPWWLDRRENFELTLAAATQRRPERRPQTSGSLAGNDPFLELALDDTFFSPGEVIGGSVAFGNVDAGRVRAVEASLVAFEEDRGAGAPSREAARYRYALSPRGAEGGREIPLRLRVPEEVVPAFAHPQLALGWALEVRLDVKGGADVQYRVPILLGAYDAPPAGAPLRRLVGAGRWAAVWAEVGRRHGLALREGDLELGGRLDGCDVTVRTAVHDGHGELSAALRWEPLGLDLLVEKSRFGALLGVDVGDAPFQRRFRVRGRDAAQVRSALTAPLRRALLAFDEVRLDDAGATLRSAAPGHDQPWIGDFVARVAALAAAARAASAQLLPPPALADALPAWRAFAADRGGALTVGDLSVRGAALDGARLDLVTTFDRSGAPAGAALQILVDPPLAAPFDPSSPEDLAAAPPPARAALAAMADLAADLRLDLREARLDRRGVLRDPEELVEPARRVLALCAALRGDRALGPYR
jgi:hypothetical protein